MFIDNIKVTHVKNILCTFGKKEQVTHIEQNLTIFLKSKKTVFSCSNTVHQK